VAASPRGAWGHHFSIAIPDVVVRGSLVVPSNGSVVGLLPSAGEGHLCLRLSIHEQVGYLDGMRDHGKVPRLQLPVGPPPLCPDAGCGSRK
jgi:hypothetical protein